MVKFDKCADVLVISTGTPLKVLAQHGENVLTRRANGAQWTYYEHELTLAAPEVCPI